MNLVTIAWKRMRQRSLTSLLTALSVSLGVALMITVIVINGVVTQMFGQSASGFDLVVGAKGSAMQLVLNTIYFMDKPIENLPYKYYLQLKKSSAITAAIPFALGDSTQDGQFRIVGTIPEYFKLDYIPGKYFALQDGAFFEGKFEAVVGARVARTYGWKVGDKFPIAHGGNIEDIHDEKFTVAGILAPTGTPSDRAVFINLGGFYSISGHEKPLEEARARERILEAARAGEASVIPESSAPQDAAPAAAALAEGEIPDEQKEVTAVLLRMRAQTLGILYMNRINEGPIAQAVNPMSQIGRLLRNFVGNIRTMLLVMTVLIIIVSGVGIFVSIYNSLADQRREIAIMRALGARRTSVFSIIIAESILLCLCGGLAGILLGHGLVFVAAPIVESRSDILINPWSFEIQELLVIPALLVLAVVVGVVPGISAYRTDVARGLSD